MHAEGLNMTKMTEDTSSESCTSFPHNSQGRPLFCGRFFLRQSRSTLTSKVKWRKLSLQRNKKI